MASASCSICRSSARNGQKAQLRQRIEQLNEEIRGLKAQRESKEKEIKLIDREKEGVHDLWKQKLVPLTKLTQLERDATRLEGEAAQLIAQTAQAGGKISETELQIIQIDQDLSSEVAKETREIDGKIGEFVERKVTAEDQLKRIDIRAPQDGTVFQSNVHTVGGVITAGDAIMLIVPEADNLTVEAKVNPQDIDQVQDRPESRCCGSPPSTSAPRRRSTARSPAFPPTPRPISAPGRPITPSGSRCRPTRSPSSAMSGWCPACRSRPSCRPATAR